MLGGHPQLYAASWGGGNFPFLVHSTDLAGLFSSLYVVGGQRKGKELTFAWGIEHR